MEKSSVDTEVTGNSGDLAVVEGFRAMARGFRNFASVVTATSEGLSTDHCDRSSAEVLDSWPEKLSAWRAALYVNAVVLRTDLEIVGTSSDSSQPGNASRQSSGRLIVGHL